MNLVMLPMWILSGVFFSSERFPEAVQPLINLLPLTALNQLLRGIMLEGQSLAEALAASRDFGRVRRRHVRGRAQDIPVEVSKH